MMVIVCILVAFICFLGALINNLSWMIALGATWLLCVHAYGIAFKTGREAQSIYAAYGETVRDEECPYCGSGFKVPVDPDTTCPCYTIKYDIKKAVEYSREDALGALEDALRDANQMGWYNHQIIRRMHEEHNRSAPSETWRPY